MHVLQLAEVADARPCAVALARNSGAATEAKVLIASCSRRKSCAGFGACGDGVGQD